MEGSDVGRVYWQENGLHRIEAYCRQDVLAVFRIMMHYQCLGVNPIQLEIRTHSMNNDASASVSMKTLSQ
jgi:hypothetical protein